MTEREEATQSKFNNVHFLPFSLNIFQISKNFDLLFFFCWGGAFTGTV